MAAPIPREAPVTSAQPSSIAPTSLIAASSRSSPADDPGTPREPRAERRQQNVRAGAKAAVADRRLKCDRERRGGRIADLLDAIDDPFGSQAESLAQRARDPRVCLVIHE